MLRTPVPVLGETLCLTRGSVISQDGGPFSQGFPVVVAVALGVVCFCCLGFLVIFKLPNVDWHLQRVLDGRPHVQPPRECALVSVASPISVRCVDANRELSPFSPRRCPCGRVESVRPSRGLSEL